MAAPSARRVLLLPRTGGPPATYQASGTPKSSSATSHVVSPPAGIEDGDLLVCVMFHAGTPVFTPPPGWAEIADSPVVLTGVGRVRCWSKVAAGESGNYTWATDTSILLEAQIHRIAGALANDPVLLPGAGATGSGTTATAPALHLPGPGVLLGVVCANGTRDFSSSAMTETADNTQSGFYVEQVPAGGPTGSRAFTINSSATWGAVLCAVRD